MDHLLVPSNPQYPPGGRPIVPHVCANRHGPGASYDNGIFLEYPGRADKPEIIPNADAQPFWDRDRKKPGNDKYDFEPFFQSWIFFGLLHHLLSPFDLYDEKNYIAGHEITTTRLIERTSEWIIKVNGVNDPAQRAKIAHGLVACLDLAEYALRCLWRTRSGGGAHPRFDRSIRLSLATLCESVTLLGETTFVEDSLAHLEWPHFANLAEIDEEETADMLHLGWCPNILRNAKEAVNTVGGRYFLRLMRPTETNGTHKSCTESNCAVMQIRNATYRPRHVSADCSCDLIGPDLDDVARCLDAKTYPVLRVTGDDIESVSMQAIPFVSETSTPYVALSHVWADGLGNPWTLDLPRCQVLRLSMTVKRLRGQTYKWQAEGIERTEDRELLLWCDSLLCPIRLKSPCDFPNCKAECMQRPDYIRSAELYHSALGSMKKVYANSAYTIVLDWSLLAVNYADIGRAEAIVRIMFSGWAQRLWTYQESVLPAKLLFHFKDKIIDFRTLGEYLQENYRGTPLRHGLLRDLCAAYYTLRDNPNGRRSGDGFHRIADNVAMRGRSVPSDEGLCITTLLGLDSGPVAEIRDGDQRVAKFWQLLSRSDEGLADNLIFNSYPRLKLPGLTWAPSTFVRADLALEWKHLKDTDAPHRAELTDSGLLIRRPGWRLRLGKPPRYVGSLMLDEVLAASILFIRGIDGRWYTLNESNLDRNVTSVSPESAIWDMLRKAPHEDWVMLIERARGSDISGYEGRCALIGFLRKDSNGKQIFKMQKVVGLAPALTAYSEIVSQAEMDMGKLRQSVLFRAFQCSAFADKVIGQVVFAIVLISAVFLLHSQKNYVLENWQHRGLIAGLLVLLPKLCDHVLVPILTHSSRLWSQYLLIRINTCIQKHAAAVFKTEKLATFFRSQPNVSAISIAGYFVVILTQRLVYVDEALDDDFEWCVD